MEIQLLGGVGASSISIIINDVLRVVNFPLAFAIATVVVTLLFVLTIIANARPGYRACSQASHLVGRQNTLPLYLFGAMNSDALPTLYAFFGSVIATTVVIIALVFAVLARIAERSRDERRPRPAG
jgi:hypothetical protein